MNAHVGPRAVKDVGGLYVGETMEHLGEAEGVRAIFERLASEKTVQCAVDVCADLHVLVLEYVTQRLQQAQ